MSRLHPAHFILGIGQQMFWAILALAIALSAVELRCEALQLPAAPGEPICTAEGAEKTAITVCTLNVQAGIPYSGKIAEYRACPGEKPQFSAFWETAGETSNLKEDDVSSGVLIGTHTWKNPGEYQIRIESESVSSRSDLIPNRGQDRSPKCATRGSSGFGHVHVFAPLPPISMFISARNLQAGRTYLNAGAVALRQPAPPSGTLLTLETDQPGKIDVETSFGRTGLGRRTTYLWIKPGSNTRSFDLIVAPGLPEEFEAQIKSDCAGAVVSKSECDAAYKGISTAKSFAVKTRENSGK
ncbi:MAG: hypothetical protein DMG63_18705 [Acidobacteria bacterium]|nr:MAG: hypothetical protein DMG63_18705 [Acidobacteriota bacterium]